MQQRQLRLGDILDDYCPRERRLTNHAVVAMVGPDVKQTRCTTCDAEHEYKHAKVPRQRKKSESGGSLGPVAGAVPKRVTPGPLVAAAHGPEHTETIDHAVELSDRSQPVQPERPANGSETAFAEAAAEAHVPGLPEVITAAIGEDEEEDGQAAAVEEGPVHRPLIRATLPRPEGQPPAARPAPEFTIRQPGGRPGRFRPRHQRGAPAPLGNRSNGKIGGAPRGARAGGGRPPQGAQGAMSSRPARRQGGRKRSK
jgi:hypothetical protein